MTLSQQVTSMPQWPALVAVLDNHVELRKLLNVQYRQDPTVTVYAAVALNRFAADPRYLSSRCVIQNFLDHQGALRNCGYCRLPIALFNHSICNGAYPAVAA
jgi:hypothetical protein